MAKGSVRKNGKKLVSVFALSVMVILSMSACSYEKKAPDEKMPPDIIITIDGKTIDYMVGLNQWNGAVYDREDTLKYILKESSGIEVPYIKLGGTIEVEFVDNPPAAVELYDNLIDKKGNNRYSEKEIRVIPVKLENGKLSFEFNVHWASMLCSNLKDYEDGKTYRGFRLCCKWDKAAGLTNNDCEYGFVIRTDANSN